MKARGLPQPGRADALFLSFAAPILAPPPPPEDVADGQPVRQAINSARIPRPFGIFCQRPAE